MITKELLKMIKMVFPSKSPIYLILLALILLVYAFNQNDSGIVNRDYGEEIDGVNASIEETKTNISDITSRPFDTLYTVSKVVDGDTIKVEGVGTVRLVGVDTPETVDPRKKVECFGTEASNRMKELVEGKGVKLEFDSSQGLIDKYGRVLAYVYTQENTFVNLELIEKGYAFEYTYSTPYKYQQQFKQAQEQARSARVGLWGNVCRGEY